MKKLVLASLCILVQSLPVLSAPAAVAQTEHENLQIPAPGILPDNPLYFLDSFGKTVGLLFTSGQDLKMRKALDYAEERLAEAMVMASKNKPAALAKAIIGYCGYTAVAVQQAQAAAKQLITDLDEQVATAAAKHLNVLDSVYDEFPEQVPEQARNAIFQAGEASMKAISITLMGLVQDNPRRAAEISMEAAQARLNRARTTAGEHDIDEVKQSVKGAETFFVLGKEIARVARDLHSDSTEVEEFITKTSARHFDMLAEVFEMVSAQTQGEVQTEIENVMKREDPAQAKRYLAGENRP